MGLFRLFILFGLGFLLYRIVKRLAVPSGKDQRGEVDGLVDEMVQDPQCKTFIPKRGSRKRLIQGEEHHFCSQQCADQYEESLTDKT